MRFSTTISDLAAVFLIALLAAPALDQIDTKGFASTANRQLAAVTAYLRNPLTVFSQRSPGARGSGALIQTKHRRVKLANNTPKPEEQVLANVRYPLPVPAYINDLAPVAGPGFLTIALPGPGIGTGGPGISPPGIPAPVAPVVIPPGGLPRGTIVSAVPEPTTWFMLIWGMAMVGIGLRAKQRHLAKAGYAAALER